MKDHTMSTVNFKDFSESFRNRILGEGKPVFGQFEITFRCNIGCVHCYVAEDHAKHELTFQEITDILDQIHQEGCLWLCITGGEPLLRKDFLDIYTYAIKKGFLVTLFTNGTLITPEIADYLLEYPPFKIDISLHGITQQTYERITSVPGSFEKCMRGIGLLLERGLPLTLKSVGMSLNRDEILTIKKYVEGLGKATYMFDSIIHPRLDGSKEPCQYRLLPQEIIDIEYSDEDMLHLWKKCFHSDHTIDAPAYLFSCGAGFTMFNISPYGELQPCHLLRSPSFNLRKGSLREGLNNLFPKVYTTKYQTDAECQDCQIRHICHQCPARAQLENEDQEMPVDYFCELAHRRHEMKGALVD